jgi:hypothetical protein
MDDNSRTCFSARTDLLHADQKRFLSYFRTRFWVSAFSAPGNKSTARIVGPLRADPLTLTLDVEPSNFPRLLGVEPPVRALTNGSIYYR